MDRHTAGICCISIYLNYKHFRQHKAVIGSLRGTINDIVAFWIDAEAVIRLIIKPSMKFIFFHSAHIIVVVQTYCNKQKYEKKTYANESSQIEDQWIKGTGWYLFSSYGNQYI